MSERIHEILLLSRNADGSPHIAPMGLRRRGELWLLAPFRPSRTLDNLLREGRAAFRADVAAGEIERLEARHARQVVREGRAVVGLRQGQVGRGPLAR